MRGLLLILVFPIVLSIATPAAGEEETAPQNDWMVHMDRSTGSWRYVPERIVLVPGGTVQLMVFGEGQFSLVLDHDPASGADIASAGGNIRTDEFAAPREPGEYPFHDKYHPEARGVLVVRERAQTSAAAPVIGVVPGGYEARFAPDRLEVSPGASVLFRANGSFGHNLQAVDGSFGAGDLSPGEERTFTAPAEPGEYPFECRFHKDLGMVGVLVVRAGAPGAAPPAPTPAAGPSSTPEAGKETPAAAAALAVVALGAAAVALARRR